MLPRRIFNPGVFVTFKPSKVFAFYFNGIIPHKSFHILKKHIKAFVIGFEGASELRTALMNTNSYEELEPLLSEALNLKLEML